MLTNFTPLMGAELFENKGMLMAVITVAGIVIVFAILVLLIFIFYAYGAIFSAVTASKEKKKAEQAAAAAAAKAAAAEAEDSPASPAELPADGEIPGEIIAVIAAAVASLSDGKTYRVKKVTRAPVSGRTPWAAAGLLENVRPF